MKNEGKWFDHAGEWMRRLEYLFTRNRRSRELADEMAFHREMNEHVGRPRKSFGNELRIREEAREAWGWTWIDRIIQDLTYAARTLRRSPGFTITAVLVLAVGIGINVGAFSLFNLLALKSLPVRDPDTLLRLQRRSPEISTNSISYPQMMFYSEHAKTLSAVMGTMGNGVELDDNVAPVSVAFTTANYFTELGTQPFLGRLLEPQREDAANAAPVVVLSYVFWQNHFNSDTNIVGKTIHINHKPATVIGVTPYAMATLGGEHPNIWIPIKLVPYFIDGSTALTVWGDGPVEMWGRMAPGVTAKAVEAELLGLTNELRKQQPKTIWDKEYIRSDPGGHDQVPRQDFYTVIAMVGALVLLILIVACANLGGLLLARGVSREHEIGIRIAIGANRRRIFRQLFTESLLLASLGAAAGMALGYVVLRITMLHAKAPLWMTATPDWRVVLFAMGVAVLAAVIFGFAPALQIARQKQRKTMARQLLLGAQVAASCVLLIVSGLLVRAAQHAIYTDPGFGYQQVLSVDLGLGEHGYKAGLARVFIDQYMSRLRSMPGVTHVALTSMPPLQHFRVGTISNTINGHLVRIFPFTVDPEFFTTVEVPIVRGRNFMPGEQHAVIVSESLARKQWPGENPLGKTDASGASPGDVVIGVSASARLIDQADGDATELYHAAQGADMPDLVVLVKTAGAPDGLQQSIRTAALNLDPKLFPQVRLLKEDFKETRNSARNIATVISVMGMVAILLAGLGILGLVAYTVSQRTKEIAIRLALGADRNHVLLSVLRQFSWPVLLGLLVGTGLTAAVSQVLHQSLYGISHLDPLSYLLAIVVLLGMLGVAAVLPARRALKLDVARALHQE